MLNLFDHARDVNKFFGSFLIEILGTVPVVHVDFFDGNHKMPVLGAKHSRVWLDKQKYETQWRLDEKFRVLTEFERHSSRTILRRSTGTESLWIWTID